MIRNLTIGELPVAEEKPRRAKPKRPKPSHGKRLTRDELIELYVEGKRLAETILPKLPSPPLEYHYRAGGWTCRHCGTSKNSVFDEFCRGCGIEDCNQGEGDELPRDRRNRLAGKRGGLFVAKEAWK